MTWTTGVLHSIPGNHPCGVAFRGGNAMNLPVASYSFLNKWATCNHQAYRIYISKGDLAEGSRERVLRWPAATRSTRRWRTGSGKGSYSRWFVLSLKCAL